MSRGRSLALVAVLLVSSVGFAVGPVSGAGGVLTVSTSVTPERPAPGEEVTVTATVQNPDEGSTTYSLRQVELRETTEDNSTLYDDDDSDTSLAPGESATRELTTEIEESGEHTFVLHMQVLSGGEVINFERTVTVTTGEVDPALSLSAGSVGANGETTFALSLSNARTDAIRGVTVDVAAENVQFDERRRVVSQLDAGSEATLQYPASNVTAGTKSVTADVTYTTSDGEYKTVTRELTATVDPVENPGNVTLSDLSVAGTDGEVTVSGQANNVGATNVSAVTVAVADGTYSLGEAQSSAFVGGLGPSTSGEFSLTASVPEGASTVTIPLSVTYRVGGETVTREVAVEEDFTASGNISLTGLRVEQQGRTLTVRGSASNLGTDNASAVTVAVGESGAVRPAQAQSSYFVGPIPESDFKSFQVDARLTAATNETVDVPIRVSYRVDGQRITETITVPYTPSTSAPVEQPQRTSSVPFVAIGGAAIVLLAGALGYRRYR